MGNRASGQAAVWAGLGALLLPAIAVGFAEGYLPLGPAELGTRVPLAPEGTGCGPGRISDVGPSGIEISSAGVELVLRGLDRGGAPFRVDAGVSSLGCSAWSEDLDADGTRDLVLLWSTGGAGLSPSTHFFALLFDSRGRPVPWEADGYYEEDRRGLPDLLDMDRDGRAELIRMSFDDGYWITSAYEATAGHWTRVRGSLGTREFPLFTRFTRRPSRVAVAPAGGRSPFDADLSNALGTPPRATTLSSVTWADTVHSEDPVLLLSDGRRCQPTAWHSTFSVVVDRPGGREAATLGAPGRARELLEAVARGRLSIAIAGQRARGRCTPELLWARE